MLNFNRIEISVISLTLIGIILATTINLRISYMRSRDVTRKNDIRTIYDALHSYRDDYASFPQSEQGRIVACFDGLNETGIPQRTTCEWAADPLPDIFGKNSSEDYLERLPSDPKHIEGRRYLYLSNGRYFQVFASLEDKEQDEFNPEIVERNLMCGNQLCNYGRAPDGAPLEISIEEYENELREDAANKKQNL